jgi:hypothetical protein
MGNSLSAIGTNNINDNTYKSQNGGNSPPNMDDFLNPHHPVELELQMDALSPNDRLDYIAAYYILTMDMESFRKLYSKEYCSQLTELISETIERFFTKNELIVVQERIDGTSGAKQGSLRKTICLEIAKMYVKIAHIFAVILTTINPEYVYTDMKGNVVKRKLYEKDKIPKYAKVHEIHSGICDSRIALLKGNSEVPLDLENADVNIDPQFCKATLFSEDQTPDNLGAVTGIPELKDLYYDDEYDVKDGSFKGMSRDARSQYETDLKRFYTAFTQDETMPDSIQSFSDIELRKYGQNCSDNSLPVVGNTREQLIKEYAVNLRDMMKYANDKQSELLQVLDRMFQFVEGEKRLIRVRPDLTATNVQDIVEDTRDLVVSMYIKCEEDYQKGIQYYEALVESNILETTQRQIDALERKKAELING